MDNTSVCLLRWGRVHWRSLSLSLQQDFGEEQYHFLVLESGEERGSLFHKPKQKKTSRCVRDSHFSEKVFETRYLGEIDKIIRC